MPSPLSAMSEEVKAGVENEAPDMEGSSDWLQTEIMFESPSSSQSAHADDPPTGISGSIESIEIDQSGDDAVLTPFDLWCDPTAQHCECQRNLLHAIANAPENSPSTSSDSTTQNALASKVKILETATKVQRCACSRANDAILYLLLYAVEVVLAAYADEAARLSFEGSICVDLSSGAEISRIARATRVFAGLAHVAQVLDALGDQTGGFQRHGMVDGQKDKFKRTRQEAWAAIRPLDAGWADMLACE